MKQSCAARWGVCVVALWLVAAAGASGSDVECSGEGPNCNNDGCVPVDCDDEDDCETGSGDSDCLTRAPACGESHFQCQSGMCLPRSFRCDGNNDCGDNSDEDNCVNHCREDQFSCGNGRCVSLRFVCDRYNHCGDGSDEIDCSFLNNCDGSEFRCGNGQCVSLGHVCNSRNDCGDGSDESNCWSSSRDCDPATEFNCNNGNCVSLRYVCDGMNDCGDYTDESGCSECRGDGFWCSNGRCVPQRYACDDRNDCGDGSDERNCWSSRRDCDPATEFSCRNGNCVPLRYVCDGMNDCRDYTDESGCSVRRAEGYCRAGEFRCSSGECVPLRQFCDGARDCRGGDDEAYNLCTRISEDPSGGNSSRQDVEPSVRCAAPYTAVRNMCLLSVRESVSWDRARNICWAHQGGYLADIDAVEDLKYIIQYLQQEAGGEPLSHPYWVGLANVPERGFGWKLVWVTGRVEPRFSPLMTYHEPITKWRLCGYIPLARGGQHFAARVELTGYFNYGFVLCRTLPLN